MNEDSFGSMSFILIAFELNHMYKVNISGFFLRFIMYACIRETGSIVRQQTMGTRSEENKND